MSIWVMHIPEGIRQKACGCAGKQEISAIFRAV